MSCREYARSLINNLSLLSKYVLVPTEEEWNNICQCLDNLQAKGHRLDDLRMRQLIYGSPVIDRDPDFLSLKLLVKKINKKQNLTRN